MTAQEYCKKTEKSKKGIFWIFVDGVGINEFNELLYIEEFQQLQRAKVLKVETTPTTNYVYVDMESPEFYNIYKLTKTAQSMVKEGTTETSEGNYIFDLSQREDTNHLNLDQIEKLVEILYSMEEVADVDFDHCEKSLSIYFYLDYCKNLTIEKEEDE